MSGSSFLPAIEKLKGRENFETWKFAVRAYLEHENLWKHVDAPMIGENTKMLMLKRVHKRNERRQNANRN